MKFKQIVENYVRELQSISENDSPVGESPHVLMIFNSNTEQYLAYFDLYDYDSRQAEPVCKGELADVLQEKLNKDIDPDDFEFEIWDRDEFNEQKIGNPTYLGKY